MTSEDAINLAGRCRPDLVPMDIRLAEGNGVEAAQAIHSRWAIPSLFATSYVEYSGACRCRSWLLEEAIRLSEPCTKHPDRRAGDERA